MSIEDESEKQTPNTLLAERALEDYLVENIHQLDGTLTVETRQHRIGVGIIDILAKDRAGLVIIELKIGQADDTAVAQVARYLGWMRQEELHTDSFLRRQLRAVLVASDFTNGARCAALTISGLTLYRFKLAKLCFSELPPLQ